MTHLIGITGGSASGKTYLLNRIQEFFSPDEVSLISQDNYYLEYDLQVKEPDGSVNFDHPQSVDLLALANDIQILRQGKSISRKEYTFNNREKTPKIITVHPAPVVVVEGLFIYYQPEIARQIDFKIFIESHEYIRLTRRIIRDQKERGRTLEDVLEEYNKYVAPMYKRYVEPFRDEADVIIPNHKSMKKASDLIILYIDSLLKGYSTSTT
ncbi:MAG: uridine kinase [Bacteroidia bacterium]|nr:uridine kinase [Bacteroidia bacterium]MDW8348573.1 uridine kinase [Bacteroidia bacterium]